MLNSPSNDFELSQKKKKKIQYKNKKQPAKVIEESLGSIENEEIEPREKYMTLGDHFEELRKRIFAVLGVWVGSSAIAGIFIEDIHNYLVSPFKLVSNQSLLLGTIYGPLEIYFKLAFIIGFIISLPLSLFILWGFITPALEIKTARVGNIIILSSTILFWLGVWFSWEYLFPLSLKMMLQLFLPAETIAQTTIEKYYSFLFFIIIGTGIAFQLPLVIILFGAMGIITTEWHKKTWKFVVIILFTLSAFITPPDPFSMFVLALPLIALYFISIVMVWIIEKRN